MFKRPWSAFVTYRHVLGDWPEAVCAENTREYYANRDTKVPEASTRFSGAWARLTFAFELPKSGPGPAARFDRAGWQTWDMRNAD